MHDRTEALNALAKAASEHRGATSRGPMPSRIWEMAIGLCRAGHPLEEVAQAGRLNAAALALKARRSPRCLHGKRA